MNLQMLGLKPYVLIELNSAEEDGEDTNLGLSLSFGGGLGREEAMELIKAVAENSGAAVEVKAANDGG